MRKQFRYVCLLCIHKLSLSNKSPHLNWGCTGKSNIKATDLSHILHPNKAIGIKTVTFDLYFASLSTLRRTEMNYHSIPNEDGTQTKLQVNMSVSSMRKLQSRLIKGSEFCQTLKTVPSYTYYLSLVIYAAYSSYSLKNSKPNISNPCEHSSYVQSNTLINTFPTLGIKNSYAKKPLLLLTMNILNVEESR